GGAGASAGYSNAGGGGSGYLFTSTSDKTGYSGNIPNSKYYLSDAFTVTDSRTGGGYVKIVDLTSSPTGSVILDISGTPANCIIISWSDTEIKCATSSHVAGVVDVTVTSIDGSASVNNGTNDNFEYQVAVDPTIMSGWVKSYDDVNNYYDSAQDYYYFEIEFDVNMLPIVHRETGGAFPAYWCDYVAQRWCNAVTLVSHKNPSANGQTFNTYDADGTRHTDGTGTYTPRDWYILHAPVGTEVSEDDILGYWVYIPRFAYQVNRLSATDPAVCAGGSTTSGTCSDSGYYQGTFDIVFQKRGTSYCSPSVKPTAGSTTKCTPTASGHWATHPAFTIGSTELAGLWVGKFETTGSTTAPTVKPNLKSQAGFDAIGTRYDIAGSAGKTKPTGSNNTTITQNNQNFQRFNTHQQKNVEWGAVAYLSASAYGTNDAKVLINSAVKSNLQDGNGSVVGRGITGCGPRTTAVTDDNSYSITDTNTTGAVACMYNGVSHSYDTSIGVLASTTHNVYGVYDMNGGEWESVLGYNGSISDMSNPDFSSQNPNTNLVNFYPSSVFNGVDELANNSFCTWQYCGGHALHEVRSAKTISAYNQSWGSDGASFVFNDGQGYRWFIRGGFASHGDGSGVWASAATNGTYIFYSSFRIVASSF
ncbi:MAG: hypothetical protein LBQ02_04450, partial [Candidatus Nomurabacteria bacterium]|nr:hypothetical protein [Candidatus Nomurabacteria bacterium]